jgi:hypothetical protein
MGARVQVAAGKPRGGLPHPRGYEHPQVPPHSMTDAPLFQKAFALPRLFRSPHGLLRPGAALYGDPGAIGTRLRAKDFCVAI